MIRIRGGIGVALLMLIVGVAVVGLGIHLHTVQSGYAGGISTTGKVSDVATLRSNSKHTLTYAGIYSFRTRGGQELTVTDSSYSGSRPELGAEATVSYREAHPDQARVLHGWHGWSTFPIVMLLVGGLLALIGLARSLALGVRALA